MYKLKDLGERNTMLDIVRIIAFFCVVSVHFFMRSELYSRPIVGIRMFVMCCLRSFFMICVPLFVLLSGYLEKEKKLCKAYFFKITKVLTIYVLATIAVFIYKKFFMNNNLSLKDLIEGLLDFSMIDYAWYIEMYIGLFLLIPFLNIMYNSLSQKKGKQCLILIFFLLTSLPTMINVYNFNETGWWSNPAQSISYQKLFPYWWGGMWPVTYYFIGCYIKDYPIIIKKSINILYIIIITLLYGLYCYWRSYGANFVSGVWQNWGALPILLLTVLVFSFLVNIRIEHCSKWCKLILKQLSDACLGAYLVSVIFDTLFYPKLVAQVTDIPLRLNYFFIMVGLVFFCSLFLSMFLLVIYNYIVKVTLMVKSKNTHKNEINGK